MVALGEVAPAPALPDRREDARRKPDRARDFAGELRRDGERLQRDDCGWGPLEGSHRLSGEAALAYTPGASERQQPTSGRGEKRSDFRELARATDESRFDRRWHRFDGWGIEFVHQRACLRPRLETELVHETFGEFAIEPSCFAFLAELAQRAQRGAQCLLIRGVVVQQASREPCGLDGTARLELRHGSAMEHLREPPPLQPQPLRKGFAAIGVESGAQRAAIEGERRGPVLLVHGSFESANVGLRIEPNAIPLGFDRTELRQSACRVQHETQVPARVRVVLVRPEHEGQRVAARPGAPIGKMGKQLVAALRQEFPSHSASLGIGCTEQDNGGLGRRSGFGGHHDRGPWWKPDSCASCAGLSNRVSHDARRARPPASVWLASYLPAASERDLGDVRPRPRQSFAY